MFELIIKLKKKLDTTLSMIYFMYHAKVITKNEDNLIWNSVNTRYD